MKKLPSVVIVGRPNVGKSSLFNRILRRRAAVVSNREGVTRDRHFQIAQWNERHFTLVDTGGYLVDDDVDVMAEEVRSQIVTAIENADFIIFMTDVRVGITEVDLRFSRIIRKSKKPFILAANKSEREEDRLTQYEFLKLGLGDPHAVSASTGFGIGDLLDVVSSNIEKVPYEEGMENRAVDDSLKLALLGRPNAGKSTLLNRILGEERMITSDIAGTTRDSVDCSFVWHKQKIILTDTAGLRKKAKVNDEVEYFSNMRSIESIRRSDVCMVMVDATRGVEEQDYRIMEQIRHQDKGLVLILNKWDAIEKSDKTLDTLKKELVNRAPDLQYIPILTISALDGKRVHKVLETAKEVFGKMRTVLGRDELMEVFRKALAENTHPNRSSKNIVMSRVCQTIINPIVVTVETNHPDLVDKSWKRFFLRRLHREFDLLGAPVKLNFDEHLRLRSDEELAEFLKPRVYEEEDDEEEEEY